MSTLNWSKQQTIVYLLLIGLALAVLKIIYLFFNFYNIFDLIVFFIAGYAVRKKVTGGHWGWGFVLALPSIALSLFFVLRLGYNSIASGVGTGYAVALIIMPLAACLGILINNKRTNGRLEGVNS